MFDVNPEGIVIVVAPVPVAESYPILNGRIMPDDVFKTKFPDAPCQKEVIYIFCVLYIPDPGPFDGNQILKVSTGVFVVT